jgi:hypothetical protein
LLILGPVAGIAATISDVLTVSDTQGFFSTSSLLESQEPGAITISFPGSQRGLPEPNEMPSDFLTISPFTVTLTSDADGPGPDLGEFGTFQFRIAATSNVASPAGVSDILAVNGLTQNLLESQEPGAVTIPVSALTLPLAEGGSSALSDTLSISDFTVMLSSVGGGPDVGEQGFDTITISAFSDVPEPSTLILVGLGLAGVLACGCKQRLTQKSER